MAQNAHVTKRIEFTITLENCCNCKWWISRVESVNIYKPNFITSTQPSVVTFCGDCLVRASYNRKNLPLKIIEKSAPKFQCKHPSRNLHTHSLLMKEHNSAVSQLKFQITAWIMLKSSYYYRADLSKHIPLHQVQHPHTLLFQKNLKWNL
jgi:hypothetical protein